MTDAVKVGFVPFSSAPRGILVVFCDDTLKFGSTTSKALGAAAGMIKRAAAANQFKGKNASTLDFLAPEGVKASRLIVVGTGKRSELKDQDFLKLGGAAAGKLRPGNEAVTIIAELPAGAMKPEQAAAIASGVRLRAYKFDRYKTRKKDGDDAALSAEISLAVGDVAAAKKAFASDDHIVDGVIIARELVNEPPNVLFPVEFARRASQLRKLGVDIDVLDVKAMKKLGMGALLGVGQGSTQPSRTVIMRWNGGKKGEAAGSLYRQGRLLRHRRHFDQARREHGGHEGRHGRCGLRGRTDACAGRAQGQGQRGRRHRPCREHARRQCAAARRYRDLDVRSDHRDHQHRRRRPSGAGRRALVCGEEVQAEIHGRSGDADRRDHGGARHRICRTVFQQRSAGGTADERSGRRPANASGGCRSVRNTTSRSIRNSPT